MGNEYPRMLYRPGKGQGEMVWGHRVDTNIVQSKEEESAAIRKGWYKDPSRAIKKALRKQKLSALWQFYLRNWQWLWGTLIAIILAVFVGA